MARSKHAHPDDDALLAFVDAEESLDSTVGGHVAACRRCSERVASLRETRLLLKDVGTVQLRPEHDIARRAVGHLRLRQTAIGNMNEVFAAVRALLRGFADLFGGAAPERPSPRRDEEAPHG